MLLRIEFNNHTIHQQFIVGNQYTFTNPSNALDSFTTEFLSLSRIDGFPIFQIKSQTFNINNPPTAYINFIYQVYSISNIHEVKTMSSLYDHNGNWYQNKEKLYTYLLELHGIDPDVIMDDNNFKTTMRNLKLKKLLK